MSIFVLKNDYFPYLSKTNSLVILAFALRHYGRLFQMAPKNRKQQQDVNQMNCAFEVFLAPTELNKVYSRGCLYGLCSPNCRIHYSLNDSILSMYVCTRAHKRINKKK